MIRTIHVHGLWTHKPSNFPPVSKCVAYIPTQKMQNHRNHIPIAASDLLGSSTRHCTSHTSVNLKPNTTPTPNPSHFTSTTTTRASSKNINPTANDAAWHLGMLTLGPHSAQSTHQTVENGHTKLSNHYYSQWCISLLARKWKLCIDNMVQNAPVTGHQIPHPRTPPWYVFGIGWSLWTIHGTHFSTKLHCHLPTHPPL